MTIIQVIQTLNLGLLQKLETTHRKYSEQQQFSLDNPIQFNSVVKCEFKLKSERESKSAGKFTIRHCPAVQWLQLVA